MNLYRIVQKLTNKNRSDGSPYRDAGCVLLFVFLLPYVVSCLWGHIGEEAAVFFEKEEDGEEWIDGRYAVTLVGKWGTKQISMQEYLVRKLQIVMPDPAESGYHYEYAGGTYEIEALKAQAVLLRTQLWGYFLSDGQTDDTIALQDDVGIWEEDAVPGEEASDNYKKAVCDTDGLILSYKGAPVMASFFPVSNGQTREASEVLPDSDYPYLRRVECGQDILAKDYQSRLVFTKEEYDRLVRELFPAEETADGNLTQEAQTHTGEELECVYDGSGYVTEVRRGAASCSGETFRYAFGLPSASFQMETDGESVIFHVKGVGHGLGMSQYGANEMALSGEKFDRILDTYFFPAELVKIE